jgi:hypothetical protein
MNVITFTTGILGGNKVWAEVRNGETTVYRTTEYVTERMAYADAYCWLAFHGGEKNMTTYTLAVTPMVEGGKRTLPGEYATKDEAWVAVQKTEFNEAVTVFADGKGVGTFQWMFKTADEPDPNHAGYVRRVRDLCKWTRAGWVQTGVQAVGIGDHRFIRTVKL